MQKELIAIEPPQIYSIVPAILPPDLLFGPLFHDVQINHVFPDSNTFADYFPKRAPGEILSLYEIEKHKKDFDLKDFVCEYFEIPPLARACGQCLFFS